MPKTLLLADYIVKFLQISQLEKLLVYVSAQEVLWNSFVIHIHRTLVNHIIHQEEVD